MIMELVVVNQESKSPEEEIVRDLIAIVPRSQAVSMAKEVQRE